MIFIVNAIDGMIILQMMYVTMITMIQMILTTEILQHASMI